MDKSVIEQNARETFAVGETLSLYSVQLVTELQRLKQALQSAQCSLPGASAYIKEICEVEASVNQAIDNLDKRLLKLHHDITK